MNNKIIDINNNIRLHYLNENKYKTNFISIFLTVPLSKETVTINSLIPAILKRGTQRLKTMKEIETEMEEMYGSNMDCGVDKSGNNHILKFYIESIKDEYVSENMFEKSIKNISELVLKPYREKDWFCNDYVEQEKKNLEIIINDKINDKLSYATQRCIEEIYNKDSYGLYTYGYAEDLNKISNDDIFDQYINILQTAKIDIFVITNKTEEYVIENINKYFKNEYINNRKNIYLPNVSYPKKESEIKNVKESLDVVQGKLMIGLNFNRNDLDFYDITVCNAILGVGCNSKIFKNVREREHLVYSAGSSYIPNANIIVIKAGIEIKNYEKALDVIKQQLNDIRNNNITDKEFDNAKQVIISSYKTLIDEQAKTINYYINQEMLDRNIGIEEAIIKVQDVKLEDVVNVANSLEINTIYFLKDM